MATRVIRPATLPKARTTTIRRENFTRISSSHIHSVHYDLVVDGTPRRFHVLWDDLAGDWTLTIKVDEKPQLIQQGEPPFRHNLTRKVAT